MTRINCNDWVRKSLHGALVNPIIGLAEDRLHSPVGQSQCHDEKPKKQNQPTTKQEQNTRNTKTKTKNKTKKKHPKRKIGIVNKASSVEKRCLVHHGGIIVWRERTKHDTEKSKTCAIHKHM